MEIKDRILQVRKSFGLSQEAFGEPLHMSRSMIVNLEMGRLKSEDQVIRCCKMIASHYGVSEAWLISGDGEMHEPPTKNQKYADVAARLKIEDDELKTSLCEFIVNADSSQLKASLYELVQFLRKSGIDFDL